MRDLFFIAGPCVIESKEMALSTAEHISEIARYLGVTIIYKSSFDKANRSSAGSFRGPGFEAGLRILESVRSEIGIDVLTDVHEPWQAEAAAEVVDVLQIPAMLCRQTDLVVAAAMTGKTVNIKKGQFMAPRDMGNVADKASMHNPNIWLCERGTTFGYNNLVVDMRGLAIMRGLGRPVVFDATHSVQLPGANGTASGGEREFVPLLARAAVAAGVDGVFMETHPDPDNAPCDGPNAWPLDKLEGLIGQLMRIDELVKNRDMME